MDKNKIVGGALTAASGIGGYKYYESQVRPSVEIINNVNVGSERQKEPVNLEEDKKEFYRQRAAKYWTDKWHEGRGSNYDCSRYSPPDFYDRKKFPNSDAMSASYYSYLRGC